MGSPPLERLLGLSPQRNLVCGEASGVPGKVKLRLEQFYAAVRKATPQVRVLAERYGGDVSFTFDSNARSVWVMALFGKGAPPAVRTVSDREVPWTPLDEEQDDGGNEEEG